MPKSIKSTKSRLHLSARACTINRTVTLPTRGPDFLGAADFLALLAYPSPGESSKRNRFCRACVDHTIKSWVDNKHINKNAVVKVRSFMTNKSIGQTLSAAWRRIRGRRIPAAEIALRAIWFSNSQAVDAVRKKMLRAEIIHRIEDEAESANKNIMTRVRKDSTDVLHLALALNSVIHKMPRKSKVGIYDFLNDPQWVRSAINSANGFKAMLIRFPGYEFTCSSQLDYRIG